VTDDLPPFVTEIETGMTPVPKEDEHHFDRETRADLDRRLREFDRVRARAAVECRSVPIGARDVQEDPPEPSVIPPNWAEDWDSEEDKVYDRLKPRDVQEDPKP
jgi:hypothetical protein